MDAQSAAERIYTLRQAIKQYEDEIEMLSREHFAKRAVDTYVEGPFQVVVGRNARFNAALVEKARKAGTITEEQYQEMLETKPSGTKAKAILSPVVYLSLQKNAEFNKVTIQMPEDD